MKTREFKVMGTLVVSYKNEDEIKELKEVFDVIKNLAPIYPEVGWSNVDFKLEFKEGMELRGEV